MCSAKALTFVRLSDGAAYDSLPDNILLSLAIGNFDGVHVGHRCLIDKATALAHVGIIGKQGDKSSKSGVFCFREPPADILTDTPPLHITELDEKLRLFGALGADYAVIADFSALKELSPEDFISLLRDKCACENIVCGFNFRFGKNGKGTAETLLAAFGDRAVIVPPVLSSDGVPVSSSRIRTAILDGDAEKASELLGRPFALHGSVVHGKALGRRWKLPTINQNFAPLSIVPLFGIYISLASFGGKCFPAVTNIGVRPTVEDNGKVNAETHILDFSGELYGEDISVYLLRRIRSEKKFSSEEELRCAIESDAMTARKYFEENKLVCEGLC